MNAPIAPPGWTIDARDCVGSTNEEAAKRAEAGAAEGLIVSASQQVSGRGRRGRRWQSPPGNAYSSVILRPDCAPLQAAQLGFVVSLAVAEAVGGYLPPHCTARLKWPNDVLIDGAKIAGILLESSAVAADKVAYVIVGVGINVAYHPPLGDTPYPTTSLQALGATVEAAEVLQAYWAALAAGVERWRRLGFGPVREQWLALAANLGQPIEVKLGKEHVRGIFQRLDESGALILAMPEGGERRIAAGEVLPVAA